MTITWSPPRIAVTSAPCHARTGGQATTSRRGYLHPADDDISRHVVAAKACSARGRGSPRDSPWSEWWWLGASGCCPTVDAVWMRARGVDRAPCAPPRASRVDASTRAHLADGDGDRHARPVRPDAGDHERSWPLSRTSSTTARQQHATLQWHGGLRHDATAARPPPLSGGGRAASPIIGGVEYGEARMIDEIRRTPGAMRRASRPGPTSQVRRPRSPRSWRPRSYYGSECAVAGRHVKPPMPASDDHAWEKRCVPVERPPGSDSA